MEVNGEQMFGFLTVYLFRDFVPLKRGIYTVCGKHRVWLLSGIRQSSNSKSVCSFSALCPFPRAWESASPNTAVAWNVFPKFYLFYIFSSCFGMYPHWTTKIIHVGNLVWGAEVIKKASVGFMQQEVLVYQDMEVSLDPDRRKGQLLLTQLLGLEMENF